jgi:hypothetical protein
MYKRSDPTLDLNRLRNVEMFKMSQFEPISFFLFAARICSERLQKAVLSNRERNTII